MIEIKPITTLDTYALQQLITGYTAHEKYVVNKTADAQRTAITLELVSLVTPYVKVYDHLDADTLEHYGKVAQQGWTYGAFDGETLVGIALTEHHVWNSTLWVWDFHVAEARRGNRIGQRLMEQLATRCRAEGIRAIICETQNTNVPAIRFYRKVGFTLEGVDLIYYTNEDYPDGEIAVFMKWKL
jgi:streptothricin acetyltransferase